MKGKRRRVCFKGILNHCYQNTVRGDLIFYNDLDRLVFFTRFCVTARAHKVRVLSVVLMPDHLHGSYVVDNVRLLSDFVKAYTGPFAREHNQTCHRHGMFFRRHFGSSPKKGDKAARTNLIYLGNNPVERRLCRRAEEYRWSFLAYADSDHPFSEKLVVRRASSALKKALKEVESMRKADKPLSYNMLKRLYRPLDPVEREQLTDRIIVLYNVIDYESAIRFFGSYDQMLQAMHASTGNEYDLNEVFVGKSDEYYAVMADIIMEEVGPEDIHDILGYSLESKYELYMLLRRKTGAPGKQIAKFLHLPMKVL